MKITVNVECTPEEARAFMGLPDVAPIQQAMLREIEDQMRTGLNSLTPESILKTWLPLSVDGMGTVQKMIFDQMQNMLGTNQPLAIAKSAQK